MTFVCWLQEHFERQSREEWHKALALNNAKDYYINVSITLHRHSINSVHHCPCTVKPRQRDDLGRKYSNPLSRLGLQGILWQPGEVGRWKWGKHFGIVGGGNYRKNSFYNHIPTVPTVDGFNMIGSCDPPYTGWGGQSPPICPFSPASWIQPWVGTQRAELEMGIGLPGPS